MSVRSSKNHRASHKRTTHHLKNRKARVRTSRLEHLEDRRMLAVNFSEFLDPNPNPGNEFGEYVVPLSTGNVVITSPYDDAGGTDAGAVYLFNGQTGALISTLTGSSDDDRVGLHGVMALTNGNYVVASSYWDNNGVGDVGAVTWGSGTVGISGVVSDQNSLVGSKSADKIGFDGVTALTDGNYVVASGSWDNGNVTNVGAVTWGDGVTGISGAVNDQNSLVGSTLADQVGKDGVTALINGNYVVRSSSWDNSGVTDSGAVTWGSGTSGISGVVTNQNSLVGSTAYDRVGSYGVTALTNGNYVVRSSDWDSGTGAVTWGSGTAGISGVVSSSNSLVGSVIGDSVGSNGVTALTNGNYVVRSSAWANGSVLYVGAVTWGSGTTGISGTVSSGNSLVGSTASDHVGYSGVTALTNGNYVVSSQNWDDGSAVNVGAVTWGSGTTGISGTVSSSNSLVGSTANNQVGYDGVTALANGNYVVSSSLWDNGDAVNAGAVTWGNGTTGITGTVSSGNSLVGSTASDHVGYSGVTALTNGNYVVSSSNWDNGSTFDAGAVTWGSGTTGISGTVSSGNSLVGSTTDDKVGSLGVTALTNGNYVVRSSFWDNGSNLDAGAVTWGSGTTGISGTVSSGNSLVGSTANDYVGSAGVTELTNGNYVIISRNWDNESTANAGAVTWGSGTTGISGTVSSGNSVVGGVASSGLTSVVVDDVNGTYYARFLSEGRVRVESQVQFIDPNPNSGNEFGQSVVALSTGNVVITSPYDDAGGDAAGAVYLFDGQTGALISTLTGSTDYDHVGRSGVTALTNGNYVVASGDWDNNSVVNAGAVTWGSGETGISGVVSAQNSLVGLTAYDYVGSGGVTALTNGNFVVASGDWDNSSVVNAGAVTWGSGETGISGVVSAQNSLVGSTAYDYVGSGGVTALTNGNYVVASGDWDLSILNNVGAVTWGSGVTGISGVISNQNSLVGSTAYDSVGNSGVMALTNGNYVVSSRNWANGSILDAGAVTWGSGTTGITGTVSSGNSLVGSTASDQVGRSGVTALTNGNYVVASGDWDNSSVVNAGAVTWGSGETGISGVVSAQNSLVGSTAYDYVGSGGVTALTNGNYVVRSFYWDNGSTSNVGAVTWGNGSTGITGTVSSGNSLVGSAVNDYVGTSGVTALTNGNYVVSSSTWDNGSTSTAGAVTWGDGTTGISGTVSSGNSLVGSAVNDQVGYSGVTALTNGNYVVRSSFWANGSILDAGAVTWGNGTTGITGTVSSGNSLVGSTTGDYVGYYGVTALTNGDYVVRSPNWDNGSTVNAGAVTWGDGSTGISGTVSSGNSLVGSTTSDLVGYSGVTALTNGNYVVRSNYWDNGSTSDAGAVTWGNGTTGISGTVSSGNSVVGGVAGADTQATVVDDVNGTFYARFTDEVSGRVRIGTQFAGLVISYDFGDAPESYPTLYVDNGAMHVATGPRLGNTRDSETNGVPTAEANGDGADEDGVTFFELIQGALGKIETNIQNTSQAPYLDAWVDFNQDGDWDDEGEQIFVSTEVSAGISQLTFEIPATATLGETYARFRLSNAGGLSPDGVANDGEVEDYQVTIKKVVEFDLPSGNSSQELSVELYAGNVELYEVYSGTIYSSTLLSHVHSVIINGVANEENRLTINYDGFGFFSLPGGIQFNGGSSGTDKLWIRGDDETESTYHTAGTSRIESSQGGQTNWVEFNEVETLWLTNMLSANVDGSLSIGSNSLTVGSISQLELDSVTTLDGGTLNAFAGVSLGNGDLFSGTGEIYGAIAAGFGSTINLTGNLTLGDAMVADGFSSDGRLYIGANTATIYDANEAVLGSLTTLGTGGADGTLNAPNGTFLEEGKNLQGRGTVQGDFHNDGHVISTNDIIFNGQVDGIGDFSGTVTFNGGTNFGHSPTETEINGNANFGSSNTHTVELGGNAAGSEYDQISSTGSVNLDGTLDVQLIDSFTPQAGDSFEILNAANGINGSFGTVNLPELSNLLEWEIVTKTNTITLSITYSAEMIAMFDMALVTTPTTTNADGSVTAVPTSMTEIHEWQGYFIEVYAQVPAGIEEALTDVEFTLNYDNTQINLDLGNIESGGGLATFSTGGPVGQLMISGTLDGSHPNLGIGSPFLVARIPASSAVVANVSGAYPVESNATLPTMSDSQVDINQFTTPVDGADAATATTTIKAVRYDINDDDRVGLVDLSMLVNAFGRTTTNSDLAFRSDFDKSGSVGLTDLSRLVNHFGFTQGDNHEIVFPTIVEGEAINFMLQGQPVVDEDFAAIFVGPAVPDMMAEPVFTSRQAQPDLQYKNFATTPLLEAKPIRNLEKAIADFEPVPPSYELDTLWAAEYEQLTEDERLLELAAVSEIASNSLTSKQDQANLADDLFAEWGV